MDNRGAYVTEDVIIGASRGKVSERRNTSSGTAEVLQKDPTSTKKTY